LWNDRDIDAALDMATDIREGKVTTIRKYSDTATLMRQLVLAE
jgi:hypothetical protein